MADSLRPRRSAAFATLPSESRAFNAISRFRSASVGMRRNLARLRGSRAGAACRDKLRAARCSSRVRRPKLTVARSSVPLPVLHHAVTCSSNPTLPRSLAVTRDPTRRTSPMVCRCRGATQPSPRSSARACWWCSTARSPTSHCRASLSSCRRHAGRRRLDRHRLSARRRDVPAAGFRCRREAGLSPCVRRRRRAVHRGVGVVRVGAVAAMAGGGEMPSGPGQRGGDAAGPCAVALHLSASIARRRRSHGTRWRSQAPRRPGRPSAPSCCRSRVGRGSSR